MAGDLETGVAIMRLTEGLDSGPVALMERVEIEPGEDFGSLSGRLAEVGGDLTVRALRESGQLEFAAQSDEGVTYAEKIEASDRELDPARAAAELANVTRALNPHIGAFLRLEGDDRLGVIRAEAVPGGPAEGVLEGNGEGLLLGTGGRRASHPRGQAGWEARDVSGGLPSRQPLAATGVLSAGAATPARRAAFEVLRRVFEHEAWADRAFPAAAERHSLERRERAQAQSIAYGAVQRRGTTDHFIGLLAKRRLDGLDAPVVAALRLGLYELLYSESADHAAVDAAVELAKGGMRPGGQRRAAGAAGLVNAVLRRAAAEREELLDSLSDDSPRQAAVAHSVPEWLAAMWWEELGAEEARSLLRTINEPAETVMRVNTIRTNPQELRAELETAGEPLEGSDPSQKAHTSGGGEGLLHSPEAIVWEGPLGPAALAALEDGRMFAQSRGAQAVVEVLDPQPGERVLDLCAGPGTKTVAIAARVGAGGEVVAVERDPRRARQIEDMAARADADNVRVVATDAAGSSTDVGQGYDRVLVDPPCSGLGTLASRPDVRWRKDPEGPARLGRVQSEILDAGIEALRPGGTIVYSTCTISQLENESVVEAALASDSDLELVRRLDTRPDRDGTDGFYIAEISKAGSDG